MGGDGLFGLRHNSLFEPASWVDLSKKPGRTRQPPRPWGGFLRDTLTLSNLFFSPNLIWLGAAIFVYVLFPYDLEAAREWSVGWVAWRLLVNTAVVVAYYEFWYITLYVRGWGKRKYAAAWRPPLAQRAHNIYYSLLGVLQWTAMESAFLHCYATGRLPFVSDADLLSAASSRGGGLSGVALFALYAYLIPLWRSFHFYLAHRFLHFPAVYRYVHSLHHRSVDVDVWSGLAMHPVEHLYYYACLLPSIYLASTMSPFHMLWNGIHLLLSPAASHSGWEDHTQGDQFHYVHHAKFECNYGSGSMQMDHLFGTFLDRLPDDHGEQVAAAPAANNNNNNNNNPSNKAATVPAGASGPHRRKESLAGADSDGDGDGASVAQASSSSTFSGFNVKHRANFTLYMALSSVLLVGGAWAAVALDGTPLTGTALQGSSFAVSFGPLVLGMLLAVFDRAARGEARRWFAKQCSSARGTVVMLLHLAVGTSVTALPIYHLCMATYSAAGSATAAH